MKQLLLVIMIVGWLTSCATQSTTLTTPQLTVAESMNRTDMSGFLRADTPRDFTFPADHGPHPGFAVEWWYFTGNLRAADGHRYGYQFTIFRSALQPTSATMDSAWATNAIYMAHLAVSDIDNQRFVADERFSRDAVGLAGAQLSPWRVWLDDWQVTSNDADITTMQITASNADVALSLTLDSTQVPVLQGDAGLSQKSSGVGNASYYYSMPRMPTAGTLTIGDTTVAVTGNSWMDREWSTSALDDDQIGWDWFALQFEDGRDLMLYHLRRPDGSQHPYSGGSWHMGDGVSQRVSSDTMRFAVQETWQSPHTGAMYPVQWRIDTENPACQLDVTAQYPDQELLVTVRYWEGAVRVSGTCDGQRVAGVGYLEMTGYADQTP